MSAAQKGVLEAKKEESRVGQCPSCKVDNVKLKEANGLWVCEKCGSKKFSSKVRKAIQEAFDRQEEQRRKLAWRYRIEMAKRGVKYFDMGYMLEALKAFREYLQVLEHHYNVEPDGLRPELFESNESQRGEGLLVAGIYWDMAKIYDHIKGHGNQCRQCLNKFIEFSVNTPHLIVASEAVRKYLKSKDVVHRDDFERTHEYLRNHLAKCFIASAVFGPRSEQVEVLQRFRDDVLQKSFTGKKLIALYYRVSPLLALFSLRVPAMAWVFRLMLLPIVFFIGKAILQNSKLPSPKG